MRPDILWIVTTQWRAQACSYAGDPNARTPFLDALAAGSVNFTDAVTPHPFGPFARAAMLTGVPSPANGVRDYFDPLPVWREAASPPTWDDRPETTGAAGAERGSFGGHRPPLQGGEGDAGAEGKSVGGQRPPLRGGWTIAHEMKERGYATAFFGKWHLSKRDIHAPPVGEPHARMIVPPDARGGFEFWEGFEGGFLLNDPWLHGTRLPEPVQVSGYQSDVVCARAADWLRPRPQQGMSKAKGQTRNLGGVSGNTKFENANAGAERPWFAVVSLEAPHPPYDVALPAGVRPRDPREIVLPANVPRDAAVGGEIEARARRELSGYYAHIEATDRAIGALLREVDAAAARDGRPVPIVVFTSVHGDMHGAHGLFRKGWPYEESVRVPLLIRLPAEIVDRSSEIGDGRAEFGDRRSEAVSLVDLPAMTLAWADGSAASAVIDRRYSFISMPSVVVLPHQCDRIWRGVRTATRKLILNADGSPWLFFDLANDPGETRNLIHDASRRDEWEELRRVIAAGTW